MKVGDKVTPEHFGNAPWSEIEGLKYLKPPDYTRPPGTECVLPALTLIVKPQDGQAFEMSWDVDLQQWTITELID